MEIGLIFLWLGCALGCTGLGFIVGRAFEYEQTVRYAHWLGKARELLKNSISHLGVNAHANNILDIRVFLDELKAEEEDEKTSKNRSWVWNYWFGRSSYCSRN